jgi:hypothetical protein
MRDEIISIIKILGIKYNEVIIDIDMGDYFINSIELRGDDILLHTFVDSIDFEFSFEELSQKDKNFLYLSLRGYLYN